jgi:hypothetical protein
MGARAEYSYGEVFPLPHQLVAGRLTCVQNDRIFFDLRECVLRRAARCPLDRALSPASDFSRRCRCARMNSPNGRASKPFRSVFEGAGCDGSRPPSEQRPTLRHRYLPDRRPTDHHDLVSRPARQQGAHLAGLPCQIAPQGLKGSRRPDRQSSRFGACRLDGPSRPGSSRRY